MNTTHDPKRIIAGALLSGGLVLAGLGLGAGAANADPGYIDPIGPYHWCPGGRPWMSIGTRAFATPTGTSLPGPVTLAGLAIFITTLGRDPIHRGYLRVRASPCGFRRLAPTVDEQSVPSPLSLSFVLQAIPTWHWPVILRHRHFGSWARVRSI
jgi:hypothetical protein